jgi:putative FmdB family regulatory protein
MPLYDYHCENCGSVSELLMNVSSDQPQCSFCGSPKLKKLVSAHSSLSGAPQTRLPGWAIPAAVARSRTRPTAKGPEAAAAKAVKN